MSDSDALRGFYKDFVESEAGRDYIEKLVGRELSIQVQAYAAKTVEEKALAVERMRGFYEARTLLIEMSQPPRQQPESKSKKSTGS